MKIIAPSLLAADWNNIESEIKQLNHESCKWIHFDVMDGKFVPATTYTPAQLKEITNYGDFFWDVHLMVNDPIIQATEFAKAGASLITFHFEATNDPKSVIKHVKDLNCKVGISIKPNTDVSEIKKYLDDVDVVLVMSVEPGKGGQAFIESSYDKVTHLSKLKTKHNFLIEVDGGVKDFNASKLFESGADVLVAGSFVFGSKDYNEAIENLIK